MASANQIRQAILDFVGHRDPNRFVLDFSRLSFDLRNSGDVEAIQLSAAIDGKIADVSVGHGRVEDLCQSVSMLCGDALQGFEAMTVPNGFHFDAVSTGTSTSLAGEAAAGAAVEGLVGVGRAWEYASGA